MVDVTLTIVVFLLGILLVGKKKSFGEGVGSNRTLVLDSCTDHMAPVLTGEITGLLIVLLVGQQMVDCFCNIKASCFLQPVVEVAISCVKV